MIAIDIRIRYAEGDAAEVAGDGDSLIALSAVLRSGAAAVIAVTVPDETPDPYERWLETISVRPELSTQVEVRVANRQVIAAGGTSSLALLADNIETFANSREQLDEHLHIEYFPGHYYLREGSTPLIIVAR